MYRIFEMNIISVAASLGGTVLALTGCQQGEPTNMESEGDSQYAIEVQKLKAGPPELISAGLQALNSKYGFGPATPVTAEPASGSADLAKAASTLVSTSTGSYSSVPKIIFSAQPGDLMTFRATSINANGTGKSDPVVMLIQFKDQGFIDNGVIPQYGQTPFNIFEWNDDVASGDLSAAISHTFRSTESGYFMAMAIPYDNNSSSRFAKITFDVIQAACPSCDGSAGGTWQLGGYIARSQGANGFLARPNVLGASNPHVFVIMNSLGSGTSNADRRTFSVDSEVYPYLVSGAEGLQNGNVILVDDDMSGTATVTLKQYLQ
jgi:hypothetical protein